MLKHKNVRYCEKHSAQLITFFLIIILFLFNIPLVFASKITLQSDTININNSEEYTVNVNLSLNVSDNTEAYLRGGFYKPNTTGKYCGYTWNGNTWFNGPYTGEGFKNILKITINNASWSGTLRAKIDPSDNDCSDSGTYNFKIIRYTASGGTGNDEQESLTINFIAPPTSTAVPPTPTKTPTPPTPTNTPTPTLNLTTKTPTPTPTSKIPTPTKTPTPTKSGPTPTPTNTPSPTPKITAKPSAKITLRLIPTSILGISTNSATTKPSASKSKPKTLVKSTTDDKSPFLIISAGIAIILITCAILIFFKIKRNNKT